MAKKGKFEKPRSHGGHWGIVLLVIVLLLAAAAAVLYFVWKPDNSKTEKPADPQSTELSTQAPTEAPTESPTEAPTDAPTEAPTEPPVELEVAAAQRVLESMTLEEKIYQMFMVTPESLTGKIPVTVAGETTRDALERYPVGGLIYFGQNLVEKTQVYDLIDNTQSYSSIPLLIGVDEEGGRVSRLSGIGITTKFSPMADYDGDMEAAYDIGWTLGTELSAAGFNLDFAPVADVITNPNNTEIGDRSFSTDANVAASMVETMVTGLHDGGTGACLKHFPGHGSTESDSHLGSSVTQRTLDELRQTELIPFRAGIEAGVDMVMISHMSAPNITGDNTPCDLSETIVTDLLRGELGFDGVVITDSHEMGAITQYYTPGEAAVLAVRAGCDIILMPDDLAAAAQALLYAVESGELTERRIDESILRILTMKYHLGIME